MNKIAKALIGTELEVEMEAMRILSSITDKIP